MKIMDQLIKNILNRIYLIDIQKLAGSSYLKYFAVDVKMLIINKDKLNLIARIGISPIIKLAYKSVTAWLLVAIINNDFLLVLCIILKILLY